MIQIKPVNLSVILLYQTSLSVFNDSCAVSIKQNVSFSIQLPAMIIFLSFLKNDFTKSCSLFTLSRPISIHNFMVSRWSLKVLHPLYKAEHSVIFGMVEAMRLKLWRQGYFWRYALPTEFHENLQNGSKVIRGGADTYGKAIWKA
jgi:hypothetical protein